jgi:hypothetical protein
MEHGDISGEPPKRLWVVFEGLVGMRKQAPAPTPLARRLWRKHAKDRPLRPEDFDINAKAVGGLYRATVQDGWHVDLITFLGPEFALELGEWLPGQMVYAPVLSTTPEELARALAHRPDVHRVYFADHRLFLTFGHRGAHLSPSRADWIGRH